MLQQFSAIQAICIELPGLHKLCNVVLCIWEEERQGMLSTCLQSILLLENEKNLSLMGCYSDSVQHSKKWICIIQFLTLQQIKLKKKITNITRYNSNYEEGGKKLALHLSQDQLGSSPEPAHTIDEGVSFHQPAAVRR